jgi:hypothetical protein
VGGPPAPADGSEVGPAANRTKLHARTYDLDDVQVFDTKGKKLDRKTVVKQLKKETVALASPAGHRVDPLHLRLIKDGTLVFVLPAPKGGPAPAGDGSAPVGSSVAPGTQAIDPSAPVSSPP